MYHKKKDKGYIKKKKTINKILILMTIIGIGKVRVRLVDGINTT